ncbi:hypothetical protein [Andreprevotia chitinilytica]|nr:hypothetical protein [Andreprevotia chitinilytica]
MKPRTSTHPITLLAMPVWQRLLLVLPLLVFLWLAVWWALR